MVFRAYARVLFLIAAVCLSFECSWPQPANGVNLVLGHELASLDPQVASTISERVIIASVFDPLLARDSEQHIISHLASYQLMSDTIWELRLRQGIKFHNGEPFNAEAVRFSFE